MLLRCLKPHFVREGPHWFMAPRLRAQHAQFVGMKATTRPATNKLCRHFCSATDPGLFSIQNLNKPSDFLKLASEAISTCDSLREALASQIDEPVTSRHQASEVLFALDSISKHVCNVIDAAELCRCVHYSELWRQSASNAFSVLSDYIAQLNSDTNLYRSLIRVTSSSVFPELAEEQQRFATLLKAEFERDGIHLPDIGREKVRQLQNHITHLESLFQDNITNTRKYYDVEADLVEDIIPKHVLRANVPQSGAPGKVTLSTDMHISNTLGLYSANPQLRKHVYMETMTSCPENLEVLEALRRVRHEAAVVQGFPSYAHRVLSDKMAKTPEAVSSFLDNLQARIREPYRHDMELIQKAKGVVEGSDPVQPWDVPFYSGILKARNGFDATEVATFFTIPNCINGMKMLVRELFGITMKEEYITENERWDSGVPRDSRARKFVLVSEEEQPLGTMYFDLHPREGKYVHAAHFTVLCGCAQAPDSKNYQLPVVALVCNLSSGEGNVLSHSEVETLFHEFGHALHSLLSRTTFQHLSGTRAATDFVETPSHLLEHFAWDPNFLPAFAKHYITKEVLSDEMIRLLVQSRQDFKSIELQNQLLYARFDQTLFGVPIRATSTEILSRLYQECNVPFAEGAHWHTRFGHLVTYGAGYYGYLYAQAFASDLWKEYLADHCLDSTSGRRLWHEMLKHGGAKDPQAMMRSLLGRDEPNVEALVDELSPILTAKDRRRQQEASTANNR